MKSITFVLVVLFALAACETTYQYDGQTYSSSTEALRAVREDISRIVSSVSPVTNPVGGRAKLVLPNRQRIREFGIIKGPLAASAGIEYLVDALEVGFRGNANALIRSRIFDSVTVGELFETEFPSIENFDYLIWLHLKNLSFAPWYIRSAGSNEKIQIIIDETLDGRGRVINWIRQARDLAASLAGPTVASRKHQTGKSAPKSSEVEPKPSAPGRKKRFPETPVALSFPKGSPRPDDIAVIIANADYAKRGQNIPDVIPAYADAAGVKTYVVEALGINPDNILFIKDATQADLVATFGTESNFKGKLYNWIEPGKSKVFVYYTGHGAPGGEDGRSYLVPVDADRSAITLNGYPLKTLFINMSKIPAESVTVVLEASFSGLSAGGPVISSASPVNLKVRLPEVPRNLTVIAAGAPNEIALWEEDMSHSLFTKFFLKAMSGEADANPYGNGDGTVEWAELNGYLRKAMARYARRHFGRDQTAQIFVGN